ncbi:hypothetical protein IWQ60_008025 [Tieghemiomyces parasiticus]|uniref:Transforming acidic coiled-coil-containing protein C-terminal domain-containing protein n=1 Tax=Tieghemiomyces parasiticus TaxID=78921 RepID=A0A9W8A274_9FUNG|nr:hypothetical protein IWQ60_008025 [Tieghemiomyces parasiticus]
MLEEKPPTSPEAQEQEPTTSTTTSPTTDIVFTTTKIHRRRTCDFSIPNEWAMQHDSGPASDPVAGADSATELSDPDRMDMSEPSPSPEPVRASVTAPEDVFIETDVISQPATDYAEVAPTPASPPAAIEDALEVRRQAEAKLRDAKVQRRKSNVRFSLAPDTIHTFGDESDESEGETEVTVSAPPPREESTAMDEEISSAPVPTAMPAALLPNDPTELLNNTEVHAVSLAAEPALNSSPRAMDTEGSDHSSPGEPKVVNIRQDEDEELALKTPRKQARTAYVLSPNLSHALLNATPAQQARIRDSLLGPVANSHDASPVADQTREEPPPLILFQTPAPAKLATGMQALLSAPSSPEDSPIRGSQSGALTVVPTGSADAAPSIDLLAKTPAPARGRFVPLAANQGSARQYPPSWLIPVTPAPTLLDTVRNDFVSPDKIPKYSYLEMEEVKRHAENKLKAKEETYRRELQELQKVLLTERQEKRELTEIVNEYSALVTHLNERNIDDQDKFNTALGEVEAEKLVSQENIEALQKSLDEITQRLHERQDENERLVMTETGLQAEIEALKADVETATGNFETLKKHAEQKIEEANEEINKLRLQKDKDVSLMKIQLSKAEAKIKTLEASIETKSQENADLASICNELLGKMGG